MNVVDFDGALFQDLWAQRTAAQFRAYTRFRFTDNRPLWAEFTSGLDGRSWIRTTDLRLIRAAL